FLPQFAETERCAVVTYQTQENLDQLVQDWDVYARFKRHFAIYFINPFSPTEKCWVLFPWSHNVISERASLKPGLLSIASSVDFATLAQIEQSVKGEAA
ncbi:MAG TPA: hypothetical protein VJK52_04505, partial [Candidatus Nanoarchaeia archaeon]|nr:hypothetical protein [Candidatus Nanoarchaeia archaeon]